MVADRRHAARHREHHRDADIPTEQGSSLFGGWRTGRGAASVAVLREARAVSRQSGDNGVRGDRAARPPHPRDGSAPRVGRAAPPQPRPAVSSPRHSGPRSLARPRVRRAFAAAWAARRTSGGSIAGAATITSVKLRRRALPLARRRLARCAEYRSGGRRRSRTSGLQGPPALPYRREQLEPIAIDGATTASATGRQSDLRCDTAAFRRDFGGCSRRPDLLGRAQRFGQIDIAAHRRRTGTGRCRRAVCSTRHHDPVPAAGARSDRFRHNPGLCRGGI